MKPLPPTCAALPLPTPAQRADRRRVARDLAWMLAVKLLVLGTLSFLFFSEADAPPSDPAAVSRRFALKSRPAAPRGAPVDRHPGERP